MKEMNDTITYSDQQACDLAWSVFVMTCQMCGKQFAATQENFDSFWNQSKIINKISPFDKWLKDNYRPSLYPNHYFEINCDYPIIHIDSLKQKFNEITPQQ